MKRVIYAILGVTVAIIVIGYYGGRPEKPQAASVQPATESGPAPEIGNTQVVDPATAGARRSHRLSTDASKPPPGTTASRTVATGASPNGPTDFDMALGTLLSAQVSFDQKQAAWKQLKDTGKLDQAIAELEQRMANDPRTAEYPATLGQAYLRKSETLQDVREMGILAMKADQVFDTALGLDPTNWEARFTKAVALSYWPPMLNKGQEVIDHFQTLIQQQEAQAPQPQFAMTYVRLGDQYQKAGNADYAKQVWQRGTAFYPNDQELSAKLASVP